MQHRSSSKTLGLFPQFTWTKWLDERGFHLPLLLVSFVLADVAVVSRRPDAIFNSQFFAEDVNVWFAEAYNDGWARALAITHTGYFQTLPRLGAALALAVPLQYAPLVMNLVGLLLQVAPAVFLLSVRSEHWAPLRIRVLMALAYLALPNTSELNVSITEAQWHLALLACLVVLSRAPESRAGFAFDLTVLALCGLTGPFCIVLFPVAFLVWWKERTRWHLAATVALGSAAILQSISLLSSAVQTRASMPLGASFDLLCRILVSQIFLAPLFGMNSAFRRSGAYVFSFTAIGVSLSVYCGVRARLEWKHFIAFAVIIFAGWMIAPQARNDQT